MTCATAFLAGACLTSLGAASQSKPAKAEPLESAELEEQSYLVTVRELGAQFTRGAVTLTPYTVPDNLADALLSFSADVRDLLDKLAFAPAALDYYWLTSRELGRVVESCILANAVCIAWNTAKAPHNECGAQAPADYDFIDLYALSNLVVREVIADATRNSYVAPMRSVRSMG